MIYQLEISAVTILVFILIFYVIAQIIKNNSIIDIGWGLGFLTISTVLLLSNGNLDIKDFLITSCDYDKKYKSGGEKARITDMPNGERTGEIKPH